MYEQTDFDVSFGSDNHSGVHPAVLLAITQANRGHVPAYGGDHVTAQAEELIRREFGSFVVPFFVFTGTAANTLAIRALCQPYEAVLSTHCAHIQEDECGAPEYLTGSKILTVPASTGKLTVEAIERLVIDPTFPHRSLPRLVSITQATEVGTVYSVEEVRSLVDAAHARGLRVHMDGARLANAACHLGTTLGEISTLLGIDALSLGGTKNGLLCAEALIFRSVDLAPRFGFMRKQSMQLASKMRYLACQFLPYLGDGLWRQNAQQANAVATYLTRRLKEVVPGIDFPYPTQANEVFAHIPDDNLRRQIIARARAYPWDHGLIRFVCSFDTRETDVDRMLAGVSPA